MNKEETSVYQKGASMPAPVLDDIQSAFKDTWRVRLALNTLQFEVPLHLQAGDVREMLSVLRDRLEEQELDEIRRLGPREYLLIKPLAPDAGGAFAEAAAGHVRALDDLGLIVRLG